MLLNTQIIIYLLIIFGLITAVVAIKKRLLLIILFQTAFIGLVTSQALWFAFTAVDNIGDKYTLGYSYFEMQDAFVASFLFLLFQLAIFTIVKFILKSEKLYIKNSIITYLNIISKLK